MSYMANTAFLWEINRLPYTDRLSGISIYINHLEYIESIYWLVFSRK